MKNSYRITFFTLDDENKASSRVRAYWIADELRKNHQVKLMNGNPKREFFRFLRALMKAQYIIFQKSYTRYHYYLIVLAAIFGKKTYLDIDDAPSRTGHPVTMKYFTKCCQAASGVLAGSPFLVNFCKPYQKHTYYLPTPIKLANYRPQVHLAGPPVIGWIGNGNHYKDDLIQILLPALLQIEPPFKLKLIGVLKNQEISTAFSQLKGVELEFVHQLDWKNPQAVSDCLSEINMGVYPLLTNDFNKYKCGFKALEYMAMAIPVIASPNSANNLIVENNKTGFIVQSTEQWVKSLGYLISNTDMRKAMGDFGYKRAQKNYSTKVVAQSLVEILEQPTRI